MTNQDILRIAKQQSADDYGFDVSDFELSTFAIRQPIPITEKSRNYLVKSPYLNFIYYGNNVIAVTDDEIRSFVENYLTKYQNEQYRIFDAPQITRLNNELERYDQCIAHLAEYFLPDLDYSPQLNNNIEVKILLGDEIEQLYEDKRFTMALHYNRKTKRRDEIVAVGYIDNKIVGVAGATNDSDTMWQIGIDVVFQKRNQKIASTLTYLLSQEILKLGKIPFYCCAWSNIASKNTARRSGFRSAWIELTAKNIDEKWISEIRTIE